MRVVISIAGFDPSGGAGTLADIKTFMAFGCFGTAAITALTSQNTVAVYGVYEQSAEVLRAQLEPVLDDFPIAAVKIGMLPTRETIEVVAAMIEERALSNIVLDPVIRSTSGYDLIDDAAAAHLVARLLPLSDLVTPNMAEAERLTQRRVTDLEGMEEAASRLREMCEGGRGRGAVLVKGGHLPEEAIDVLADGDQIKHFIAPRIATPHTHGTGCTLSAAIAALLARGADLDAAIVGAKRYLCGALQSAPGLGRGAGPINHGFPAPAELD
jgi:hydroxymethylpyrimidine kinase/phosphomethylpyrimidine kinase